MSFHGNPCWYELGTSDLKAAGEFYSTVLGWQVDDSGMPGFTYHLARSGEEMVAGMMSLDGQDSAPGPNWNIYFAVDDCDQTAEQITAAGGTILNGPADIPDTGRFAVARDPQGAVFGILQPDMSRMTEAEIAKARETGAFDQKKTGHGNWNELMTSDPEAGFDFYAGLMGWTRGEAMDMGEAGTYQLIHRNDTAIGGVHAKVDGPGPIWLPYFGVDGSVAARIETIRKAGGTICHGPAEVPGPAYIAIAEDPQGAMFAVVGPKP